MKSLVSISPPVLSCAAAQEMEKERFGGDEHKEWPAMSAAGAAIANALLADYGELGGFPEAGRVLVLAGKGHNAGDALLATRTILERYPRASASIVFVFGERVLRPLAARAWRDLQQAFGSRVAAVAPVRGGLEGISVRFGPFPYDVCLDGIFGFQFRPPVDERVQKLVAAVNDSAIGLRAAVDLPSAGVFRADFTYATGSVKEAALGSENAGRLRYLDLGFFADPAAVSVAPAIVDRVLTADVLRPLLRLRPARGDKRTYGHVFVIGGSRGYPGAVLMCAMAALRSGAGLVTAFVPESLAPGFAARLPEAIWVGWPEASGGGLALEGEHLLRERIERADALVIGPGMGREPETLALAQSIVTAAKLPIVIDADALQRDIVLAGDAPRVVTPHAGEFKRLAGDADLRTFAQASNLTVVLKGPVTRLCGGGETVFHSFFGGPVLARGGSGDLLAGMIATQIAQQPDAPLPATARAVVWHGAAADRLARRQGQVAVTTTQLLDHLWDALRG